MAFDGVVINALAKELEEKIVGARIEKIHQIDKYELSLSIKGYQKSYRLLLCANPSFPRFHLTNFQKENPDTPPMFCMMLRKHLQGGKILYVKQESFERIVYIGVESYDEMGYLSKKELVIECMGKHSNIILLGNDKKIIDSIVHVDIRLSSVRQILPYFPYTLPPCDKLNPLDFKINDLENIFSQSDEPLFKQILNAYLGISPLIAREIIFKALGDCDLHKSEITQDDINKISKAFSDFINDVKNGNFSPVVLISESEKKHLDFCSVNISQYQNMARCEYFEDISSAVEEFYHKKSILDNLKQKTYDLLKLVNNNLDRCYRKLQIQDQTLKKASKREKYKIYADLINANLYKIDSGLSKVTLENFYSQNEPIEVTLDPLLTGAKNAQRYYEKYNKEKTAEAMTLNQKKLNEEEINYLESVKEEISNAENSQDINQIRDELIGEGYLKNKGRLNKKNKKQLPKPMHFVSSDGYDIYVGKNNIQNDYLTLKFAKYTDIWFHTKSVHGSHVIIKTDDAMTVSDNAYMEAASICAYYSKARQSSSVAVDYTEVKNVKKPSGAKPGMVIYVNYNTLYVTPSEELIQKLKNQDK